MDEQFIAFLAVVGSMIVSILTLIASSREKNAGVFDKATNAQSEIIDDLIAQNERLREEIRELRARLDNCLEGNGDRMPVKSKRRLLW